MLTKKIEDKQKYIVLSAEFVVNDVYDYSKSKCINTIIRLISKIIKEYNVYMTNLFSHLIIEFLYCFIYFSYSLNNVFFSFTLFNLMYNFYLFDNNQKNIFVFIAILIFYILIFIILMPILKKIQKYTVNTFFILKF